MLRVRNIPRYGDTGTSALTTGFRFDDEGSRLTLLELHLEVTILSR